MKTVEDIKKEVIDAICECLKPYGDWELEVSDEAGSGVSDAGLYLHIPPQWDKFGNLTVDSGRVCLPIYINWKDGLK